MTPLELQALWIKMFPRPEWDDPEFWIKSRPEEAAGE
jgi:hypothetical protein